MSKSTQTISPSDISFPRYIFSKPQRTHFFILSAIYLLTAILISQLFPYPFTTADTGNYVLCAKNNLPGGYRPMGYSTFLHFFHAWNTNVKFVFVWQSILNYLSVITFVFSIKYLFNLKNNLFYVLSIVLLLHPDILKNTNSILSDSVFNSLTLMWLTTGIWMLMRKSFAAMFIHFIVLSFVINVRYIGLFYPVVSSFIILIDFRKWKFATAFFIIPIIILIVLINRTKNKTEEIFGYETFSAFSGWAVANNAVSIISHIDLKPEEINDNEIKVMHQLVKSFSDTCYSWKHIKDTDFMWDKYFPGKALLGYNIQHLRIPYNNAWIYTGMKWNKYGSYLRNKYPLQYFRYFMVPNMGGIFEVFPYASEKEYIPDNTSKEYFNIKTDKYEFKSYLFDNVYWYRFILYYAMMILFIVVLIFGIIKRRIVFNKGEGKAALFSAVFIILYIIMSVFTHPIQNYRYLIPVYPVAIMYAIIFGERIYNSVIKKTI